MARTTSGVQAPPSNPAPDYLMTSPQGHDRFAGGRGLCQGGVPIYRIAKLVDDQLEVYTGPTPTGYLERRVFAPTDDVALTLGDAEICRIAVSAILPRSCQTDPSNLEFRGAFAGVLRAF